MFKHLLFLAYSFCLIAFEEVHDRATLPLLAPDWSERQVGKIRLDNGLEAYLVSDPKTEESGAALTVKVGSWNEPEDSPGLAHFLEHMLFLGTKKYPNESEFEAYLSTFRGQSNAFTYNDITSYMFSVRNEAFNEALDRFASFFKEPLFNPSGVNREVKAIDQEWQIHSQDDDFLRLHILKELTVPSHPFSRFNSGNELSLKNASQDKLKEWYQSTYSADRMRLYVISALPLSELKALIEKDFGDIVKKDTPRHSIDVTLDEDIFDKKYLGKMVMMEPIQDETKLTLLWELPASYSSWSEERPWSLVCAVIGDEGEKSILAQLKRENLAVSLGCGETRLSSSKLLFLIEVDLTEEGLRNKDLVVERIFQGLKRLQVAGISQELFHEIQALERLKYQWSPRQQVFDEATENAFNQGYEELETYPERGEIVSLYSQDKINTFIDYIHPERAIYFLTAPSKKTGLTYPLKEKWTSTRYLVTPYRFPNLNTLELNPKIDLPESNRFIPQTLKLKNQAASLAWTRLPTPELLVNTDKGKGYFYSDTTYGVPQIYGSFEVRTPAVNMNSAQSVVLGEIYRKALQDALTQPIYDADLAGLKLKIEEGEEGFQITLNGYDEKMDILLNEIFSQLRLPHLDEGRFEDILAKLKQEYKNFALESPFLQANEFLTEMIHHPYVTTAQKVNALRNITFEKFLHFKDHLFNKNFLEGLLIGNLSKNEAERVFALWQKALSGAPYPEKLLKKVKATVWPPHGPYVITKTTKAQGTAVILALEDPDFTFAKRGAQQILQQSLQKDFFQELRTRQQTGYIVGVSSDEFKKALFDSFYIQSATHDAEELIWRIETFIETFLQELPANIPPDRFSTTKEALMAQLKERPKSLAEMGQLLQKLAFTYDGDFDWIEKRIKSLNELSYEEFVTLSTSLLGRDNLRRVAVVIQGPLNKSFRYSPIKTSKIFKKNAKFR